LIFPSYLSWGAHLGGALTYEPRYLLKTKDLGLDLTLESLEQSAKDYKTSLDNTKNSINVLGISDADWGGDIDSRKSTTANIFILITIKIIIIIIVTWFISKRPTQVSAPLNTSVAHARRQHVISQQYQALRLYTKGDVQLTISSIQSN
jgi:hypothetical protein